MIDRTHAVALFFDELRFEVGNKFSLMGQYVGELFLLDPMSTPVDRLAVLISAKWPINLKPSVLSLRIELPRQEPVDVDLAGQQQFPDRSDPESPFTARLFQAGMNLRFPPLQPGDVVNVWLTVNEEVIPAGQLRVRLPPSEAQETLQN